VLAQSLAKAFDQERPALARADRQEADPRCFRALLTARQQNEYAGGHGTLQKTPTIMAMYVTHRCRTIGIKHSQTPNAARERRGDHVWHRTQGAFASAPRAG
jgi:hypothetical protein